MRRNRRKTTLWLVAVGAVALIAASIVFGPPGSVDLIGYEELEPGVIEVTLPCHSEVRGHFALSLDDAIWVFAFGTDPQRYSFGGDDCLSSGRIDLGVPVGERRIVDGFDFSTVDSQP